MDGNHFDDMVRAASTRDTRRGALRALAGGLLAALVPAAGAGKGKRRKKKKSQRPKPCAERCGGRCVSRCPDVMTRNQSTCQCECPEGMTKCGQVCVGADRCCPGEKPCGGGCIREEDCCPHTHRECANGACIPKDACCPVLEVACPTDPRGCCIAAGEACADDGCCPLVGSRRVCDGKCVDTQTDKNHCRTCNRRCGPDQECCGGSCTSVQSDDENCGACGNACDARTQRCVGGECRDICSLNPDPAWRNRCDDGVDYWCCPDRSTTCCRLSGWPHCC